MPRIYNKLENPALQFALLHRVPREFCEKVVKGKRFKEDSLTEIAGNGIFGFQSRRQKREVASMVQTIDGTGLKKARKTATKPRKETCKLATSFQIYWNMLDPEEQKRRGSEQNKRIRKQTRNRKAGYGRRKAVVMTTNPTRGKRGGLTPTVVCH
jgi:hypothetical protein